MLRTARRPSIALVVAIGLLVFAASLPAERALAERGGKDPDQQRGGVAASIRAPKGMVAKPAAAVTGVTRLGFCGGDDWEPDIATSGSYVYAVWTHYAGATACDPASGLENRRVYIQVSADGGKTFGAPHVVAETINGAAYPSQVDSTVTVSDTGTVYVGMLAYGLSGSHLDVAVARSTDHGAAFPVQRKLNGPACASCDHPFGIAKGNDVYFAYTQGKGHFIAHSSDAGLTWTETQVATYDAVGFAEGGAIDPAGNAWFAWSDCTSSNCTGTVANEYRVSETNAGTSTTTFSPVIATAPQGPACAYSSCGFAYWGPQSDIAIDAGGTIYMTWQDGQSHTTRKSPPVVMLSRCSANCTTAAGWITVGRVDDKNAQNCAGGNCYALYPRIAAGAAGQITAMWMDDRNDSIDSVTDHTDGWNVWVRSSTNGGTSWTGAGTKVSAHDPAQGQSTVNGFLFPYGDYMDLAPTSACAGGYVYTWGEGVNYAGGATAPGHVEARSTC